jgi:hypothetical protein
MIPMAFAGVPASAMNPLHTLAPQAQTSNALILDRVLELALEFLKESFWCASMEGSKKEFEKKSGVEIHSIHQYFETASKPGMVYINGFTFFKEGELYFILGSQNKSAYTKKYLKALLSPFEKKCVYDLNKNPERYTYLVKISKTMVESLPGFIEHARNMQNTTGTTPAAVDILNTLEKIAAAKKLFKQNLIPDLKFFNLVKNFLKSVGLVLALCACSFSTLQSVIVEASAFSRSNQYHVAASSPIDETLLVNNQLSPEVIYKAINDNMEWLMSISNTATGLPPSHHGGLSKFSAGGFTYDLAHAAYNYYLNGSPEKGRRILLLLASRYTAVSDLELEQKKDANGVYGILRLLPFRGKWIKSIVNAVDTNDNSAIGSGLEWYSDGGPQFWQGMVALHALQNDKGLTVSEKTILRTYVSGIINLGINLLNAENVLAAGGEGQGGRDRLGHVENIWDFYALLQMAEQQIRTRLLAKGKTIAERMTVAERNKLRRDKAVFWRIRFNLLNDLKNKKIFFTEGDVGYFRQGFNNGVINDQIPTDVQTWAILSLGPRKIDFIWGVGTSEKLLKWIVQRSLVRTVYEKPNGDQVTTIGSDFSDPFRLDIQQKRNGFHPMISDEWTAGTILSLDEMAIYYFQQNRKDEAARVLAMADALRYFQIQRQLPNGSWQYATEPGIDTGFKWSTPYAPDGSVAGSFSNFALNSRNPFKLIAGDLKPRLAPIRAYLVNGEKLGVSHGFQLLSERMGQEPERLFFDNAFKILKGIPYDVHQYQAASYAMPVPHDFKQGDTLRIHVSGTGAVVVRLLPPGEGEGVAKHIVSSYAAVKNGWVDVVLTKDYPQTSLISVHSGTPWGIYRAGTGNPTIHFVQVKNANQGSNLFGSFGALSPESQRLEGFKDLFANLATPKPGKVLSTLELNQLKNLLKSNPQEVAA